MFTELKILAAVGIATTVLGSCAYAKHVGHSRDEWKAAAHAQQRSAHKWMDRAGAWRQSFRDAEDLRRGERDAATAHANELTAACGARVSRARQDGRAAAALMARPIKTDAQGCAVPGLWREQDLAPSLGGWK